MYIFDKVCSVAAYQLGYQNSNTIFWATGLAFSCTEK